MPEYAFVLPVMDSGFKSCPFDLYRELRKKGRVVGISLPSGFRGWLVLDHRVAKTLFSDLRLCKRPPHEQAISHPVFNHMPAARQADHTRLRGLLDDVFTARLVRDARPMIEVLADRLAMRFALACGEGEADFVSQFARPFSLSVLCTLLGLPEGEQDRIADWSARLYRADMDGTDDAVAVADEISAYLLSAAAWRVTLPEGSLLSSLRSLRAAGSLDDGEYCAMGFLLMMAGHETSVSMLSSGVAGLIRRRQWGPGHGDIRAVVEEILRFESPLEVATVRYANEAFDLDGCRISAGDAVLLGIAAANRDEGVFKNPDDFSTARRNVGSHLAFGRGPHACPGALLARFEGAAALQALFRHLPNVGLAHPENDMEWQKGLIMRGPVRLVLAVKKEPPDSREIAR